MSELLCCGIGLNSKNQHARQVQLALQRLELIASARRVNLAYDSLAAGLTKEYAGLSPVMVAVLNGGLVPSSELIRRCDFPLELGSIRAERYRSGVAGGEVCWQLKPGSELKQKHLVLIDDVLDEGRVLLAACEALRLLKPKSLSTLVLVQKQLPSGQAAIQADRVGLKLPNRFLVGEGMDIAGYGRNMRGIWALDQEDEKAFLASAPPCV